MAMTPLGRDEMTQLQFVKAYMGEVRKRYAWASDPVKFVAFMRNVTLTLKTNQRVWIPEGEAVNAAWNEIGGKGKPTLKALRSLPVE
jgi:hypothetical protein